VILGLNEFGERSCRNCLAVWKCRGTGTIELRGAKYVALGSGLTY
jgi:hypothetical protein